MSLLKFEEPVRAGVFVAVILALGGCSSAPTPTASEDVARVQREQQSRIRAQATVQAAPGVSARDKERASQILGSGALPTPRAQANPIPLRKN